MDESQAAPGMALSEDLWLWHYGFSQGQVQRRDGLVILQDEQQEPVQTWSFTRGLPVRWTGPAFNATQNAVAIEEIEIAHEGLQIAAAEVSQAKALLSFSRDTPAHRPRAREDLTRNSRSEVPSLQGCRSGSGSGGVLDFKWQVNRVWVSSEGL